MPETKTGLGGAGSCLAQASHPCQVQREGSPKGQTERWESGPPAAQLPSGTWENRPGDAPGRRACP